MKAAFIDDYGGTENLRIGDAPMPQPGPKDVLVKVEYAGLRWGDVMQRNGLPSRARPTPFIGGQEAAGVIEAVGPEVRHWRPGMRVMATPNGGGFAEYVAVHPAQLQAVPDNVPLEVMLAYPVNLRTAYYMVYVWAKVREDDRVLLHAAAGGVGLLTLQILKRKFRDVPVVAVASTEEKLRLLRAEGADYVVNRKTQDYVAEVLKIWGPKASGFATGGQQAGGVDVAFNGVSGDTLATDWQVIRKRGRWVIYGYSAGRGQLDTSKFGYDGITVMPFSSIAWTGTPEHAAATAFTEDWLRTETLIAPQIHALEDMREVQRAFEQGGTTGKVVFRVLGAFAMQLVDLTRPLDPRDIEKFPENRRQGVATMVPEIEYQRPGFEGAEAVCAAFACQKHDLPGGEGWGAERLHINTHLGTHLDAPLHYGSMCEGKPARTITDIALEELYVDGLVLDLRGLVKPAEGIEIDALKTAIANNGAPITPGCALMLRTGQEAYDFGDPEFFQYPGMTREGTLFLASTGAKILCTDALGWDRPFHVIRRTFRETGDRSTIWDAHFAGRDKEVFIVQQIYNLAGVPRSGFKVGFFPLPLARCSASPARVVAFVP